MNISKFQAYKVCYCFLDSLWKENKSLYKDDLPSLLSDMQGFMVIPPDPAIVSDWNNLIDSEFISIRQAYETVIEFLQIKFYKNNETKIIVEKMDTDYDTMWTLWENCVDYVLDKGFE